MQLTKYPEQNDQLQKVEKCYLCGRWFVIELLYSVKIQDQGGGWIVKPACKPCIVTAGKEIV